VSLATVRAYSFRPGEPPAEIQLWAPGDNPTDYGVHRWTERSVREVLATYNARGNPLQVDVEHNAATAPVDPAKPPPTGGYARLEVRAGAPWLVFDWSAFAVEQIASRQRLFLSPEYNVDKSTGEIVGLVRVSLVGDPATHHARMLAARPRAGVAGMTPEQAKKALEALISGDLTAVEAMLKEVLVASMGSGPASSPELPEMAASAPPDGPAKPEEMPVAASAPAKPLEALKVAAQDATKAFDGLSKELDAIKRDRLLDKHGHRLTEGQRTWASTQSAAVVQGLLDASPEKTERVAAGAPTRGDTKGTTQSKLPPEQKAELDQRMGLTVKAAAVRREGDRVVFPVYTRDTAAKILAEKQKGAAQ
jgi:hypothetical protein